MKGPIFLVGFMGAGKTTVGRALAKKMNLPFIDSDHAIEMAIGLSISEIFERQGESAFRQLETDWLKNNGGQNAVIALGGGTFNSESNRTHIKERGVTFYIQLKTEQLTDRLMTDTNIRPLIAKNKNDKEELNRHVLELLAKREPHYFEADHIVDGDLSVAQVVEQILDKI